MSSSRFEVQRLRRAALAEHEAGFALSRALLPRGAQQLRDRVRLEARSGMPIVGPATGTASDPDPVHLEAAAAPASASSRGTAARPNRPSSSLTATLRRSSAMRPSLARSRNSAAAGRLCDCGLRQVVGLSPRQVLDPPSIFPPGVHERREDGGLAGAGDADRYAASSALPSSSIIRSRWARAPSLRSRCRPARRPRRSGTDRVPRSGPRGGLRQADQLRLALHMQGGRQRASPGPAHPRQDPRSA